MNLFMNLMTTQFGLKKSGVYRSFIINFRKDLISDEVHGALEIFRLFSTVLLNFVELIILSWDIRNKFSERLKGANISSQKTSLMIRTLCYIERMLDFSLHILC